MKRIGVALGGGGAKGLAHIPILEVLDELGVRPARIAGTSIGAIIGALYASGRSAREMRKETRELTRTPQGLKELISAKQLPGWLDFIGVELGRNSLLNVDRFLSTLGAVIDAETFEQLPIPLSVVAADFWARREIVLDRGPIIPAVAASFAIPGIFKPVILEDRVLVDGGCVNPVPYDLLQDDCDVVVAIDVSGRRSTGEDLMPSYSETLFNTFQIAEQTILSEKIKARPPTILVRPQIEGVRVLEFHKVDQIYEQAAPEQEQLRAELEALIR